jgi:hypothetical protein
VVSVHFLCQISLELMKDPVIAPTRITYDHESLEGWPVAAPPAPSPAAPCGSRTWSPTTPRAKRSRTGAPLEGERPQPLLQFMKVFFMKVCFVKLAGTSFLLCHDQASKVVVKCRHV